MDLNLLLAKILTIKEILPKIFEWLLTRGLKIVFILLVVQIVLKGGERLIKKIIPRFIEKTYRLKDKNKKLEKERKETLIGVFFSFFKFLVWTIAILTILPELGINIGPLLAGIGILGLALGMGTKNLIQDYIGGIFIIIEDQYRVGEKVEISGKKGKVLDINLRRTVLQDENGVLHHIPNGQVKIVSNFSRK